MLRADRFARWRRLATGAALLVGCSRGARTPEEAYQRLSASVAAKDARALFDALDQETRWSWMTVQRSHREAYDIILSIFPDGPDRARQLGRFEAGATSENARALFARQLDVSSSNWARLAEGLAGSPQITPGATETQMLTPTGRRLTFRKGNGKGNGNGNGMTGGWGFSGLADEAEQIKRRAIADLEMVRTSATDYERAAARSGK